jgi:hypothetical protein
VDVSAFAVAAFHDPALAVGARGVEAVLWIRAAGLGAEGVDVALRVWTPARAEVTALREVAPANVDRLEEAVRNDDRTLQIDVGRWLDGGARARARAHGCPHAGGPPDRRGPATPPHRVYRCERRSAVRRLRRGARRWRPLLRGVRA